MQQIIQLRYVNRNSKDTLKIFSVPDKSLQKYTLTSKSKDGHISLPGREYRVSAEEFMGTDEAGPIKEADPKKMDLDNTRFSMAVPKQAPQEIINENLLDLENYKHEARQSTVVKVRKP